MAPSSRGPCPVHGLREIPLLTILTDQLLVLGVSSMAGYTQTPGSLLPSPTWLLPLLRRLLPRAVLWPRNSGGLTVTQLCVCLPKAPQAASPPCRTGHTPSQKPFWLLMWLVQPSFGFSITLSRDQTLFLQLLHLAPSAD